MGIDITAPMITALSGDMTPIVLLEVEFESQTLRLCTATKDVVFDSDTYLSAGWISGVSPVGESGDNRAENARFTLSGVPSSLVSLILSSGRQSKKGSCWLGALDATGALIADPFLLYKGNFDFGEIREDPNISSITISVESELVDTTRPKNERWNHETHYAEYPGDRGFIYTEYVQREWSGFWGRQRESTTL